MKVRILRQLVKELIRESINESQKVPLVGSYSKSGGYQYKPSMHQSAEQIEQWRISGRYSKQDFANATTKEDREWFKDNTIQVHGPRRSVENITEWLFAKLKNGKKKERREISTTAFLKKSLGTSRLSGYSIEPVRLIVDGWVSFASYEDVHSQYHSMGYSKSPAEWASFIKNPSSSNDTYFEYDKSENWNGYEDAEFILANWTVAGVIVDDKSDNTETVAAAIKMSKEMGYPVYDTLMNRL